MEWCHFNSLPHPRQLSLHVTHPMTSPADAEKAVCYTHSSSKCLPQLLCLWSMEKLMRSTQVWIQSGRQDLRTHIVLLRRMEGRGKKRSLGESFPFWPLHPSKPGVCRIDLGQVNIFPTLWQHCFVYKDMEVWGAASCWKLLAKCLWMWVWTWLRLQRFLRELGFFPSKRGCPWPELKLRIDFLRSWLALLTSLWAIITCVPGI